MRHPHWLFSRNLSFNIFAMHHWFQVQIETQEKNCWIQTSTNWPGGFTTKDSSNPPQPPPQECVLLALCSIWRSGRNCVSQGFTQDTPGITFLIIKEPLTNTDYHHLQQWYLEICIQQSIWTAVLIQMKLELLKFSND